MSLVMCISDEVVVLSFGEKIADAVPARSRGTRRSSGCTWGTTSEVARAWSGSRTHAEVRTSSPATAVEGAPESPCTRERGDRDHHRRQRRREEHAAADGRGADPARWARFSSAVSRSGAAPGADRRPRLLARAGGPAGLRAADGAGEPPPGRLPAVPRKRGVRWDDLERVYRLFPRLQERERQLAGTLSGGRAADARDRAGAHGPPRGCSCWTSRRWGWRPGGQGIFAHRREAAEGAGAPRCSSSSRTPGGAGHRGPRLRAGDGAGGAGRDVGGAAREPGRAAGVPGPGADAEGRCQPIGAMYWEPDKECMGSGGARAAPARAAPVDAQPGLRGRPVLPEEVRRHGDRPRGHPLPRRPGAPALHDEGGPAGQLPLRPVRRADAGRGARPRLLRHDRPGHRGGLHPQRHPDLVRPGRAGPDGGGASPRTTSSRSPSTTGCSPAPSGSTTARSGSAPR